jgi:hypothetical protein
LIGKGARGSADLVAYFVLRAHALLNALGQGGLLATSTLPEGDTREVGLGQLTANGVTIRKAVKSAPWPSRSVALEYCAVWTSRAALADEAARIIDSAGVRSITSSLDPASRVSGTPHRLAANARISFQGSIILGLGFTVESERAHELISKSPRNASVLFPYLNGQDLNSHPDCSAGRWVINFHDWLEDKARTFTECYEQVRRLVKPERDRNKRAARRERWWQYAERATGLYEAIAELDRIIAITRISNTVMPVFISQGQVISEQIVVFATSDAAVLAFLSSTMHYAWVMKYCSTIGAGAGIRYTPSDVFETLPLPELTNQMRSLGDRLGTYRRDLMLARQAGLTKTYNLVHDSHCGDVDISELREIHREIDHAMANAYGWDDLDLDHGFHETRQGIRYTVGPVARQEILDRLLELNHERYKAEVASGLHKRSKKNPGDEGTLF